MKYEFERYAHGKLAKNNEDDIDKTSLELQEYLKYWCDYNDKIPIRNIFINHKSMEEYHPSKAGVYLTTYVIDGKYKELTDVCKLLITHHIYSINLPDVYK